MMGTGCSFNLCLGLIPAIRSQAGERPLAYNLANFLRALVLPDEVKQWSLTTLCERLVKIGARMVWHGRSTTFQMAEVTVPRGLFQQILAAISTLRPSRC
jgi:hypothetical protein